ncbi:MAG: hypothetical protein K1X56_13285 [Flavobacteriales bacterium]|nr:hypothetical protein [Flavobacteriales bacterium]
MKSFLVFFIVLGLGFNSLNAQDKQSSQKINGSDYISGKRWKISKFKSGTDIKIAESDFYWFRPGGTFECAVAGIWENGTWSFDKNAKQVFIKFSSGKSSIYDVLESTGSKLALKAGSEEIQFVPDIDIKTDIILSGEKKMMCKTWKIQEQQKNKLKIFPKPNDFISFHPDGTYEQCMINHYFIGKWSYDEKAKLIKIQMTYTKIWKMVQCSEASLELKSEDEKESLLLKKN